MNTPQRYNNIIRIIFIVVAIVIMILSTIFTNQLARKLSVEEKKKVEIWAEATRQLILADEHTDIIFFLNITQDNTTIPVIMTDSMDNVLDYRNISTPNTDAEKYVKDELQKFKNDRPPIEVRISDTLVQYIYYDESSLLKLLQIFPMLQIVVVGLFFIIVILVFSSTKRAEQNSVWVGLSKETAHQLGTPISSLLAWTELLKSKYTDDNLLVDMERDVKRLSVIADRFSKIGSKPKLSPTLIAPTLKNAIQYIKDRSSNQIKITLEIVDNIDGLIVDLNVPLFEWVIENLCKNAIDAMNGSGLLLIQLFSKDQYVVIDVKDTGKGIERSMYKTVFTPGYTTKKRGWGLGLSLAKRIIQTYHCGKIFVKNSELNKGTTFRIILQKENKID